MYVRSVSMENFRHFRKAEVGFVYPGMEPKPGKDVLSNVTLLVGVNGSGKTSVLRAVGLAILSPVIGSSGFRPDYLVRRGAAKVKEASAKAIFLMHQQDQGWVPFRDEIGEMDCRITVRRRSDYEVLLHPEWWFSSGRSELRPYDQDGIFEDRSPSYFLLGYGATRRTESDPRNVQKAPKQRGLRYQRIAGLFEDQLALMPLFAWVPELERGSPRFKEVVGLLNATLPEGTRFRGDVERDDAVFEHDGINLPFAALSDGYRTHIGLVADMLYHLHTCCPKKAKLADMTGTVMVDDIDLHLHPEWQRVVVPELARAFPRLQFILTSHSPLVAGTLHADNVRIIEDGKVRQSEERLHGLSADQILVSPYFGLSSPRSPDAEQKLARMAARVEDSGDPSAAVAFLRELAGKEAAGNGKPDSR